MPIKLDLHIHSESHGKIFIGAEDLKRMLKEKGLDGVAITNFYSLSHALWLKKKISDFIIIVGQEVWSRDGHILGLGLKKRIENYQSAEDTVASIHEQGGLAVAVHPYFFLGLGRKMASLPIDAVEVYNAAMGYFIVQNYLAQIAAQKLSLPQLASTDTSNPGFIGQSYTEVMTEDSARIPEAIRLGRVRLLKRPMPLPFVFIIKCLLKFRNIEPCLIHAAPCFICGKSMAFRLFNGRFRCIDCAKTEVSRVICCNGHYLCRACLIKRALNNGNGWAESEYLRRNR